MDEPKPARRPSQASPEPREHGRRARSPAQEEIDRLHARLIELELQNAEFRAAQEESEHLRHVYVELYENSPVAHVVLDKDGLILRVNRSAGELLRVEPRRLLHKPFLMFMMRENLNDYRASCREAIVTRQRSVCEALVRPRDGEPFRARLDVVGMHDPDTRQLACHMTVTPLAIPARTRTDADEPDKPVPDDGNYARQLVHDIRNALAGVRNVLLLFKSAMPAEHPYLKYLPLVDRQFDAIERSAEALAGLESPEKDA